MDVTFTARGTQATWQGRIQAGDGPRAAFERCPGFGPYMLGSCYSHQRSWASCLWPRPWVPGSDLRPCHLASVILLRIRGLRASLARPPKVKYGRISNWGTRINGAARPAAIVVTGHMMSQRV